MKIDKKLIKTICQLGGSIIAGVAILTFVISSSVHNNAVYKDYYTEERNIAEEHNAKVDELVENDSLLKTPTYYTNYETESDFQGFEWTVLDVGQASCNLINCDGHYMLFDGGDRDTSSFVFSYIQNTKKISFFDYVVASHYDSDHIAGLIGIVQKFDTGCILGAPYTSDTKTYNSFYNSCLKKGGIVYPQAGDEFMLGSAKCTVISPVNDNYTDENAYSIGLRIEYLNTSFVVMGDATKESELDSLKYGLSKEADVLIVNHHGSSSSSSEEFISTVAPQISIISVGRDNDYGHPTEEVLSRLSGSEVLRTDINGTIRLVSDGKTIEIYTEK